MTDTESKAAKRRPRSASDTIAAVRTALDATLRPLVEGRRVALLDYPNHTNAGDSAIWLGEMAFLRELGIAPVYQCDRWSFSERALRARLGNGCILLHGGGNLGDLWPGYQRFRERVVRSFPDTPIVQLPQTLHFGDPANLERTREVFDAHPDLTLLLRDETSLRVARETFACTTRLCPDSAFSLGGMRPTGSTVEPVVWLSRTDAERSAPADRAAGAGALHPVDWLGDRPGQAGWRSGEAAERYLVQRLRPRVQHHPRLFAACEPALNQAYARLARSRLDVARRILSRGRVVVTDRLHGHILALLLQQPQVVYDSGYGKIRAFHDAWTRETEGVWFAGSAAEAIDLAVEIAQPSRRLSPPP